jgi:hypothetical protein
MGIGEKWHLIRTPPSLKVRMLAPKLSVTAVALAEGGSVGARARVIRNSAFLIGIQMSFNYN